MSEESKNKPSSNLNSEEHGEKENEERWLLTYADMITLLVAFFIMMYSMSVLNLEKFKELAFSIKSGFLGDLEGRKGKDIIESNKSIGLNQDISILKKEQENNLTKVQHKANSLFENLKTEVKELIINKKLQGIVDIKEKEGNIYIVILTDQIFFKNGESVLTEEAKKILLTIGSILKNIDSDITIEGYTSKTVNTGEFKNNWEMSAARAISVIKFFEEEIKIPSSRMSLTGYGEWRPFTENATDNLNDRVVIAILQKKFKKMR